MRAILAAVGVFALAALAGGCGGDSTDSRASLASLSNPVAKLSVDALATLDRDCLQYPVEKRADGVEVWNADYVYFYLVRAKDAAPALDDKGRPLATGLLHSEAVRWMEGRDPIPGSVWTWRVQRMVREVRGGRVAQESAFGIVDDADLAELLAKDRKARDL